LISSEETCEMDKTDCDVVSLRLDGTLQGKGGGMVLTDIVTKLYDTWLRTLHSIGVRAGLRRLRRTSLPRAYCYFAAMAG